MKTHKRIKVILLSIVPSSRIVASKKSRFTAVDRRNKQVVSSMASALKAEGLRNRKMAAKNAKDSQIRQNHHQTVCDLLCTVLRCIIDTLLRGV